MVQGIGRDHIFWDTQFFMSIGLDIVPCVININQTG